MTAEHWHGNTPLFEAARSGHLELCRWLVSKGADADKANEWGDTAANEAGSMGHWDIVWFLNDKGANLSPRTEHNHNTLVLSAVRHQSTDALDELQRRGLDMNARSWNGASPLHEAARTGETRSSTGAHARVSLHAHPPQPAAHTRFISALLYPGFFEVMSSARTTPTPQMIAAEVAVLRGRRPAALTPILAVDQQGRVTGQPACPAITLRSSRSPSTSICCRPSARRSLVDVQREQPVGFR